MKIRCLFFALTVVLGVRLAVAQNPQPQAAKLQAEILTLRVVDEASKPEPAQHFAVGEKVVYVTRVRGFELTEDGDISLQAGYRIHRADGSVLPVPVEVGAKALAEKGDPFVFLDPVLQYPFDPENPTGSYAIEVTVTDLVTRATANARVPLFLSLTPGAMAQMPEPSPDAPVAMEDTLLSPEFWDYSPDDVAAALWATGVRWTSVDRSSIRTVMRKGTLFGKPMTDVTVRLENETPAEVRIFAFNRGDQGLITAEAFTELVNHLKKEFTARAGAQPQDLSERGKPSQRSAVLAWRFGGRLVRLEFAESMVRQEDARGRQFQPEFISVTLLPDGVMSRAQMAGRQGTDVTRHMLARRVVRLPNGDVYLDVPMHDQGEKGYCAAAAAERVLDYFGTSISQHELAQRMDMSTGGGVSFEGMVRGLRSLAQRLGLQLSILINSDDRAFLRMVEEYNRMARRLKKPQIDLNKPLDSSYGPKSIWELFDKDVFMQSRLRSPIALNKFYEDCRSKINAGIPLIQVCMIGILPEEAELGQDPGGHARLIIGYNTNTRDILYTDSWGIGHERKRMPLESAFAITTGLMTLEPRR